MMQDGETVMSEEEYYYDDDGMVSDSALRKRKTRKTKIPKFKPIVKKKVPTTGLGEAFGGFMVGMTFVFPVLAFLCRADPAAFFLIIGIISMFIGARFHSFKAALVTFGICVGMVLLGFVSLEIIKGIFG